MPLRFKQRILDYLSDEFHLAPKPDALSEALRIDDADKDLFDQALELLTKEGYLLKDDDSRLRLPRFRDEVSGSFRMTARGFGFVIPDHPHREGDLFIPRGNTSDAMTGDRVRASVMRDPRGNRGRNSGSAQSKGERRSCIGQITEVLEQAKSKFAGILFNRRGSWYVKADSRGVVAPVLVRDGQAKGAKEGSKVVFEFVLRPEDDYPGEGVIVEVLGKAGRPDVETQAVIAAHGLRTEFPRSAIEEARRATTAFEEFVKDGSTDRAGREDLRELLTFTIDPPDARDFDDAISIVHDEAQGTWELGVHIADVSEFVVPGSALDQEAAQRGNSVYLPRHVIPMLPEILSNGICSLQADTDRLTRSAFITFDEKGRVLKQRLCASVIRSHKRLTYLEAQALIEGKTDEALTHTTANTEYSKELVNALVNANRLAKSIRKRRLHDGMIVLDLPEVELIFNDGGQVIGAQPEDGAFTHTIIEMFMVEANEALARTFYSLGLPVMRRIHPDPSGGDMTELQEFARMIGLRMPEEPDRKDLQRLLKASAGTPAARAIHISVLRTMTKASYSPAIIGHYALASGHYSHFTSPIRRYADLLLHQVMSAYLDATENGKKPPRKREERAFASRLSADKRVLNESALIEFGRQCSSTEVEAEAAERELRQFLVLDFLAREHLGDHFQGVITGFSKGAIYISLDEFLVEGMADLTDMPGDDGRKEFWRSAARGMRVVGGRTNRCLVRGDQLTVQIEKVDPASRSMSLRVLSLPEGEPRYDRGEPEAKKKKTGKNKSRRKRAKRGR
ncbi:MAG: VacB/RNase II family 3'-5' exoribonuclease [Phycisphaerales bacterium]|nr:VacB/RNase II family 3'-5' exoribonuclease [Phycisphaerales bacterium]